MQEYVENLKAYYRTHAESSEQPVAVREAYRAAIRRLDALKSPSVEELEAFIDAELDEVQKCIGNVSLIDPEKRYRPTEKAKKFRIGLPGISSDRWIEQPSLPPCVHGKNHREWDIEGGESYQDQLWCGLLQHFVNPSGFTCERCRRRKKMVASMSKEEADDWIMQQVHEGDMTQREASQLRKEKA